ncbi:MAG: hypothetical protein HY298_10480 [Verrucomicrobia bacterium]|nr:hypothetical protein [Verrucomicrobiota bacterium]
MRWRMIFLISAAMNVALAAAWYFSIGRPSSSTYSISIPFGSSASTTNLIKTNIVVRRQFFTWREVESSDYPTYIANLRDIGCPEQTIRDIIVADVNQLYAQKRATEIMTADQQWWRSQPDTNLVAAAAAKLRALEAERRALLTRLLGPNWEPPELTGVFTNLPPSKSGVVLNGPVLGALSAETKEAVQAISARAAERAQAYLEAQRAEGKSPDPAELARLRQQTRDELSRILTPQQVEEFLLRYSANAATLRNELRGFDVTPDEFRNLFRARDAIDQQIALYYSGDDPASLQQRKQLEAQRDAAMKQALSPDRLELYQLSKDPGFQQAQATAQKYGTPPEAVLPLYRINQAVEQEQQRIRTDPTLSAEQRLEQLQAVRADHEKSLLAILGEDGFKRYQQETNSAPSRTP